uniref:Fibronectin type-III domain-containing protein n=1 Tax=Paramormyrops kingsleyae TaxID=1676925 RepID=A0A3B3RCP1_9TELE
GVSKLTIMYDCVCICALYTGVLSWVPLNSTAVTGYRIVVLAAGETIPLFEDIAKPTTGYYTLYGLEPGIDYDISISTITEGGQSKPITLRQQTGECALSPLSGAVGV